MYDTLAAAPRPSPELGRLKYAAERIAKVALTVDAFLERFNGPVPQSAGSAGQPISDNYRNDLETLFGVVERLETTVAALEHIG